MAAQNQPLENMEVDVKNIPSTLEEGSSVDTSLDRGIAAQIDRLLFNWLFAS